MKNKSIHWLCVSIITLGLATAAQADVIRYTLVGVTFADGGTASGYFDWDTQASSISSLYDGNSLNYDISVSGGDASFPAFNYTDEQFGFADAGGTFGIPTQQIIEFGIDDLNSPPYRRILLVPDVTSGIPGVDLNLSLISSSNNSVEFNNAVDFLTRQISAGSLEGELIAESTPRSEPVPVDNRFALLLLIALIGGLAFTSVRKQAA